PDPLDPTTIDKPFVYSERNASKKRFKVGVIKGCADKTQPEVRKNLTEAVGVLRGFADVVEDVEFPNLPFSEVVTLIVHAEGASALRDLIESGQTKELQAPRDRWGGQAWSMVLAVDYLQALR